MTKDKTIKITDIISTADRDQGDVKSLANSISQVGMLQPILLWKTEGGKYEVVDGRRRFAAWVSPGWLILPESAYTLAPEAGDAQVMAHVANVERKNLTPSEEVRQLAELAKSHSVERLAEMFGRTPGWVARRIRIGTLIPDWLKVMDDPERSAAWPLDKLALIARQSEDLQKTLLHLSTGLHSVEHIRQTIAQYQHRISAAHFDTAACAKCPHNTATESLLFDDCPADAVCMDQTCWIRKSLAAVKAAIRSEKLTPVKGCGSCWGRADYDYAEKVNAVGKWYYAEVRRAKKGETANAIIVCGDDIGERVIAVERKSPAPVSSAPKDSKPKTVKEREEELSRKRMKRALQLLLEYIVKDYTAEDWLAKIPESDKVQNLFLVLGLYGCTGQYTRDFRVSLTPADCQVAEPEKVRANTYRQALGLIQIHLKAESERTLGSMSQDAGLAIALLLRIQDKWNDLPKSLVEARASEKAAKAAKRGGAK